MYRQIFVSIGVLIFGGQVLAQTRPELRLGRANHAFDHLGDIGGQSDVAAASGATIIYTGGLGEAGYRGLPPKKEFEALCAKVSAYSRHAKSIGIELPIGYLCATSIIKLDTFDKNWTDEFRAQFKTRPPEWRQQDRHGQPLASWYGGDYQPACMNNPDWRGYERAMVRHQLETGHDGVFFDNPTVHPHGCYCPHCMDNFAKFLEQEAIAVPPIGPNDDGRIEAIRKLADAHPKEFLRFRTTIARDFLADMRAYARTINPRALVTCNNSLNAPTVFYSQCRTYGYNINEMSKAEDFVVVEDQSTQPRTEANGQVFEYGPTYKQLHAISHGKPIVAVTIANVDYHTAPNLMRLAMAEAAANNASYLSWPTWPEEQRKRMIAAVRPEADFLRSHQDLLNDAPLRADVVVFLPFRRWVETGQCAVSAIAAALTKANIQYKVMCEDDFTLKPVDGRLAVLLIESRSVLTKDEEKKVAAFKQSGGILVTADKLDWMQTILKSIGTVSVGIIGPTTIRAVVYDQPTRTIVHLYNLNIQRLSSFYDKVTPANEIKVAVRTPFNEIGSVRLQTADEETKSRKLDFQLLVDMLDSTNGATIVVRVPDLAIHDILVIEKK